MTLQGKQITPFCLITAITKEDGKAYLARRSVGPVFPFWRIGLGLLKDETMTASGRVMRTDIRRAPSRHIRVGSCTFGDNGFSVAAERTVVTKMGEGKSKVCNMA